MEIESSSGTSPLAVQMATSSGCTDTTVFESSKICSLPVAHAFVLLDELELVDDDDDDDDDVDDEDDDDDDEVDDGDDETVESRE
jgi:hypothetical protein